MPEVTTNTAANEVSYNWQYKRRISNRQTFWYDEARVYKSAEEAFNTEGKILLACDKSRCKGHRVVMKIKQPSGQVITIPVLYLLESKTAQAR